MLDCCQGSSESLGGSASDVSSALGSLGAYDTPHRDVAKKRAKQHLESVAIQHGLNTDQEVAQAYLRHLEALHPSARIRVQPTGSVVHEQHCFINAAPDMPVIMEEGGAQKRCFVQMNCLYRYTTSDSCCM